MFYFCCYHFVGFIAYLSYYWIFYFTCLKHLINIILLELINVYYDLFIWDLESASNSKQNKFFHLIWVGFASLCLTITSYHGIFLHRICGLLYLKLRILPAEQLDDIFLCLLLQVNVKRVLLLTASKIINCKQARFKYRYISMQTRRKKLEMRQVSYTKIIIKNNKALNSDKQKGFTIWVSMCFYICWEKLINDPQRHATMNSDRSWMVVTINCVHTPFAM